MLRTSGETWRWRSLDEIDPRLVIAVMLAEDHRFPHHPGFDWRAAKEALDTFLREGRVRSGFSTIAMQTVRMLSARDELSLRRKLREAWESVMLITRYGREPVLEAYLNLSRFTEHTRGLEAGMLHHFGHGAERATPFEATFMAVILPSPAARPGLTDVGRRWLQSQQHRLVFELIGFEVIDLAEAERAAAEIEDWWAPARPDASI